MHRFPLPWYYRDVCPITVTTAIKYRTVSHSPIPRCYCGNTTIVPITMQFSILNSCKDTTRETEQSLLDWQENKHTSWIYAWIHKCCKTKVGNYKNCKNWFVDDDTNTIIVKHVWTSTSIAQTLCECTVDNKLHDLWLNVLDSDTTTHVSSTQGRLSSDKHIWHNMLHKRSEYNQQLTTGKISLPNINRNISNMTAWNQWDKVVSDKLSSRLTTDCYVIVKSMTC